MLCKISEAKISKASNVNKGRVEQNQQNTGVPNLSDSKDPMRNNAKCHKKRSQRHTHLKTSLTYSTRPKNERMHKTSPIKLFQTTRLKYFYKYKFIPTPFVPSSN